MPRFYAACTLGLEEVLVDELHGVEASNIRARRGGVEFQGDLATGYRACLWLRSATRVQEELVRGRVRDRDDLYALAESVDQQTADDAAAGEGVKVPQRKLSLQQNGSALSRMDTERERALLEDLSSRGLIGTDERFIVCTTEDGS